MDEKLRQAVRLLKGLYSCGSGVSLPADSFLEQCAANILAIATEWQPIETAPKDETPILVYSEMADPSVYVCRYRGPTSDPWTNDPKGEWVEASGEQYSRYSATHWMPLPQPPNE